MLQAGIKIRQILPHSDILPLSYCRLGISEAILKAYIHICLSATGVLKSWEELCINAYVKAGNSSLKCSTHLAKSEL